MVTIPDPPSEREAPPVTLTQRTLGGFFWAFTGTIGQSVMRLAILIVLARLLSPATFGLVGGALVVISLGEAFGNLGVWPMIVRKPDLQDAEIRTGVMLTMVYGLVMGGLTYALAPLMQLGFKIAGMTEMVRLLAWVFPLRALGIVSNGLLTRRMQFRTTALITFLSYLLGYGGVAITLALAGFGPKALAYAQITQATLGSALAIAAARHSWRPLYDLRALQYTLSYGATYTLAVLGNFTAQNIDNFIVGRWLGAEALGFYSRAYYFLMQPANIFGAVVDQVLYPAMAEVQSEPQRLFRAYRTSMAFITATTLPLSMVLIALAPRIIDLLLGSNWRGAILPFQILAASLLFRTAYKVSDTVWRAKGANRGGGVFNWLYALGIGAGAYIGHYWGLPGVATGVAAAITLHHCILALFACRLMHAPISALAAIHLRFLPFSIALGVLVWFAAESVGALGAPNILALLAGSLTAGALYIGAWLWLRSGFGPEGEEIFQLMASRLERFAPPLARMSASASTFVNRAFANMAKQINLANDAARTDRSQKMTLHVIADAALQGPRLAIAISKNVVQRMRATPRRTITTLFLTLAIGIACFTLSLDRLHHFVAMNCHENCVFGADAHEILGGGSTGNYATVGARKHALAYIVFTVLTESFIATGEPPQSAFLIVLGLLASILSMLSFTLFVRLSGRIVFSIAALGWLLFSNAVFVHLSIPETYTITLTVMVISILAFIELTPFIAERPIWSAIFAGFFSGAAALANPPATAVALIYGAIAWNTLTAQALIPRIVKSLAIPCAIAVSLSVAPDMIKSHTMSLSWSQQYAETWATTSNFYNPSRLLDFSASAIAFIWSSPAAHPLCRLLASDIAALLARPAAVAGLIGSLGLLGWGIWTARKDAVTAPLRVGLLGALCVIVLFYIYFNPQEAMLYANQWTLLFVILTVIGLRRVQAATWIFVIVAGLNFIANDPRAWPNPTSFNACCPIDRYSVTLDGPV